MNAFDFDNGFEWIILSRNTVVVWLSISILIVREFIIYQGKIPSIRSEELNTPRCKNDHFQQ